MLIELARAKLNLTLRVLGRRADGYHALESLVSFASFADTVSLQGDGPSTISVEGPFADAIDGENLLSRVCSEVADAAAGLSVGAVHLVKQLPVAAGLGGGSADAAAFLRLLQRRAASMAAPVVVDWEQIAARIGADVPVCLGNRPAMMWGVGEKLVPMPGRHPAHPALPVVLVNPRRPLATRDVFRELAAPPLHGTPAEPVMPKLAGIEDLVSFMAAVGNDLERPAQRLLPVIADMKAALLRQPSCLHAALSGSGPTCFGLYSTVEAAGAAAHSLAATQAAWWVVATELEFPAAAAISSPG